MNTEKRRTVIAGNWKMNMTPSEAVALAKNLIPVAAGKTACDIIVGVPAVDIAPVADTVRGTNIKVAAQNVHYEAKGAFTGELSAAMLKEAGAEYVIIGHSERRQYFGETNETVNLRTKAALAAGLRVILCVGEVLAERENGITEEIVSMQTKLALRGVDADAVRNVIIAYEPVWAIGTGLTATPDQAEEVCGMIRTVLAKLYNAEIAEATTIQYGGSMNDKNAAELLSKADVDGGLIGGASLKAESFGVIIDAAQ